MYEGSGHALQDPEGHGDSIFREEALRDINRTVGWLIENESYRHIGDLIEKTFYILKTRTEQFPSTTLTCVLNMGQGVYKTDEIDLVILNHSPNHFSYQILKTGKLLFCNDKRALIDFREHIIRSYLDFKYVRDAFDSVFLEGIGYHG